MQSIAETFKIGAAVTRYVKNTIAATPSVFVVHIDKKSKLHEVVPHQFHKV
jgi:hypothetical protein